MKKPSWIMLIVLCLSLMALLPVTGHFCGPVIGHVLSRYNYLCGKSGLSLLPPTPWQSVGGCGAGGSGGTAADIKWIGMGAQGGLIKSEFMASNTLGENYRYTQLKSRFSMKPTYSTELGLSLPIVSKIGALQPSTRWDDRTEVSGGITDLMVDYSKSLGMEGQYSLQFNLTCPTGQYDIKRGRENSMLYLPTSLQRGSGIFQGSIGLSRTIDVDKGLWIVEGYYNHPFAVNFSGKNRFINDKSDQYSELNQKWDLLSAAQKKRFEYYFKPYGENDLGGYTPPSLAANVYYGYRGIPNYVHSFGLKAFVPLGVTWIPDFSASSYNPVPDPDFKAWTLTLHYGLEFSRPEYPFYLSVNKLISSRPSSAKDEKSLAEWNAPGIPELLNTWTFAVGMKTSWF
jgi:hypothetical protein